MGGRLSGEGGEIGRGGGGVWLSQEMVQSSGLVVEEVEFRWLL